MLVLLFFLKAGKEIENYKLSSLNFYSWGLGYKIYNSAY